MRAPNTAAVVLWVLAAFVVSYYLTGCMWQGEIKPMVGVYIPSLKPIPAEELRCLEQQTYDALVDREVEWRHAYDSCRAVVDELTVSD